MSPLRLLERKLGYLTFCSLDIQGKTNIVLISIEDFGKCRREINGTRLIWKFVQFRRFRMVRNLRHLSILSDNLETVAGYQIL
jgi:hypothetical protein